ncbi:MAG: hypothetical protein GXP59_01680, partial [Deltaproteobacteria bacterium]|nr:hypothetical protein [Deltaproteobacteria bacterium]
MTPFDFENNRLTAADFYRHKRQFSQSISELFVCQDVWFGHLSTAGELKITAGQEEYLETLKAGANLAVQQQQPIIDKKRQKVFLPISDHDKIAVIIV